MRNLRKLQFNPEIADGYQKASKEVSLAYEKKFKYNNGNNFPCIILYCNLYSQSRKDSVSQLVAFILLNQKTFIERKYFWKVKDTCNFSQICSFKQSFISVT